MKFSGFQPDDKTLDQKKMIVLIKKSYMIRYFVVSHTLLICHSDDLIDGFPYHPKY